MKKICAILPAYNEELAIGSVIVRSKEFVDNIIVVDDGSTDGTAEIATLAGATVLRHVKNLGKGAALRTGFAAADGADIIVMLDADGQHEPTYIPALVKPILDGEADIVNGSRYLDGNNLGTPLYRRFGQIILDKAVHINSGIKVTDSQSGFRAFASWTKSAFRFDTDGMAIESEMLDDAARAGLRIKEVKIGVRYDVRKRGANPISHGLTVLVNVLHHIELRRPLFYFTIPGILFAAIGIGMGLEFLMTFQKGGNLNFGPTLLMILLTLLGSFLALTGIILHSISRLLSEFRREQKY